MTELTPSDYSVECFRRAESYVNDVLNERIKVGNLERLAVSRFVRDREREDLELRGDAVDRVFRFFSTLRHSKGRQWAGTQFILADWQCFLILCLFGWYNAEGFRRFRFVYIQVARKNGKSTFLAGIGLYLLVYDGEPGAEIYSAATKREQAKILWDEGVRMVKASAPLRRLVKPLRSVLICDGTASKFEPLGADADTLDGLNPHGNLVDELHAHKSRKMWTVLQTGMGARLQPVQIAITTAGFDMDGVCYEQRDYGIKLLEQTLDDDEYLAFIAEIDPDDDWTDENNWRKANPNLGVSVRVDELRTAVKRARAIPSEENDCRTKRLNQWVQQSQRWLSMETWDALPSDQLDLEKRICFAGLDLSATRDVTALVLVFPPLQSEPWALLPYFWVPETTVLEAAKAKRVPYDVWAEQGWLNTTPGNVVDYDFIREDILRLGDRFIIREIGFDPWNSSQIVVQLGGDGFEMVQMRQGYATLHAPTKELEKLIVSGNLNPSANPMLRWMASNVSIVRDPAGNMKPTKENDRLKIDGIVATIMGIGRALAYEPDDDTIEKPLVLRA